MNQSLIFLFNYVSLPHQVCRTCLSRYWDPPSPGMHESVFSGNAGVVQTSLHRGPSVSETDAPSAGAFVRGGRIQHEEKLRYLGSGGWAGKTFKVSVV